MNRFLKQLVYGIFYIILFLGVGYGSYASFIRPEVSCFDNKQNGAETAVDCGGGCVVCEVKSLLPLQVSGMDVLKASSGDSTLVFDVYNPNLTYGAAIIEYKIMAGGEMIVKDSTFLYPGEGKKIAHPAIEVNGSPDIEITKTSWAKRDFFAPPKVSYREVNTNEGGTGVSVTGLVVSGETTAIPEALVSIFLYNEADVLVGASRTVVENIAPFATKDFAIIHPLVPLDETKTEVAVSAKMPGVPSVEYLIRE